MRRVWYSKAAHLMVVRKGERWREHAEAGWGPTFFLQGTPSMVQFASIRLYLQSFLATHSRATGSGNNIVI